MSRDCDKCSPLEKLKNRVTWVNILKKCCAHTYATNASGTTWQMCTVRDTRPEEDQIIPSVIVISDLSRMRNDFSRVSELHKSRT